MKIFIQCFWGTSNKDPKKFFAFKECRSLVDDYSGRLKDRGINTQIIAGDFERRPRSQLWLCHPRGKALTSPQIAENFQRAMASGLDLIVAVGSDVGFSEADIIKLRPELLWSFGPLTLPHELATVVASEQLYRAISMIKNEPYHRP